MPVKLTAPLEKDFPLERTDLAYDNEGEPTKVTIRQATQARASLNDELQLRQKWSVEELKRIEVYLTLIGCNLEDEDGKSLFRFKSLNGHSDLDMTENEFKKAWGKLPPDIAQEIHEKVLEVNLSWGGPLGS